MSKNYSERDHALIVEALGKAGVTPSSLADTILTALDKEGRITPPWEPCERHEVKKGDRYRFEVDHGSVGEGTAKLDFNEKARNNERWFRIPAPTPAVEWPTEPGPYLVTWEWCGEQFGPEWFICDGETLWSTDKAFLDPESPEGDLKLLSVEKGVVAE